MLALRMIGRRAVAVAHLALPRLALHFRDGRGAPGGCGHALPRTHGHRGAEGASAHPAQSRHPGPAALRPVARRHRPPRLRQHDGREPPHQGRAGAEDREHPDPGRRRLPALPAAFPHTRGDSGVEPGPRRRSRLLGAHARPALHPGLPPRDPAPAPLRGDLSPTPRDVGRGRRHHLHGVRARPGPSPRSRWAS